MITVSRKGALPSLSGVNIGITQGLRKSATLIKKTLIKDLTTGSRSGRTYIINGSAHTASAPGEAPAKLSGTLAKSVGSTVGNKQLTIGETADYAGYLEHGTRSIAERPHLKPAVDGKAVEVYKLIGQSVKSRLMK